MAREEPHRIVVESNAEDNREFIESVFDRLNLYDSTESVRVEVEIGKRAASELGYKSAGRRYPDDNVVQFEEDSDAYKLACFLCENDDEWLTTPEIRRRDTENVDQDGDRLSQLLWDLTERGVVKKKDCPHDKRMKEYQISEKGARSVEESVSED